MKKYVLTASLKGSTTGFPILSRDNAMAKTLSYIEISKRHVSDKRWAKGNIVLIAQDAPGKKLINITEVEE